MSSLIKRRQDIFVVLSPLASNCYNLRWTSTLSALNNSQISVFESQWKYSEYFISGAM